MEEQKMAAVRVPKTGFELANYAARKGAGERVHFRLRKIRSVRLGAPGWATFHRTGARRLPYPRHTETGKKTSVLLIKSGIEQSLFFFLWLHFRCFSRLSSIVRERLTCAGEGVTFLGSVRECP